MPTLQLNIASEVPQAVCAALAAELTTLTAELLGKRPDVTAVMVQPLPAAHWFIGGQAVSQATAWLEISITSGTNTAAQKAAFVQAAHAAMQRHLGAGQTWAEASYVIVRELPASDWGYGGQTQAARQRARELAAQAK